MAFRLRIAFFLGFMVPFSLYPQVFEKGMVLVKNYSPIENGFGAWNYAIARDHRGVMYFGNNDDGVLEYDGVSWRKIFVPKGIVWSLASDSEGRIYVGSEGDFGMLVPDASGKLKYRSLLPLVPDSARFFSSVYNIFCHEGNVYFSSTEYLFTWSGKAISVYAFPRNLNSYWSFLVNGKIYHGSISRGLLVFDGKEFIPSPGGEIFSSVPVQAVLPYRNDFLVVFSSQGGRLYNPVTGQVNDFLSRETAMWLKGTSIYNAVSLPDGGFAVGTIEKGVIIIDQNGRMVNHIDKSRRLQDDGVTALYAGNESTSGQGLWVTLSSGISCAQIYSPIRILGEEQGIEGEITDVVKFNGTVYIAAGRKVYYLKGENTLDAAFIPISGISSPWSFCRVRDLDGKKDYLLVATDYGVYEITGPGKSVSLEKTFNVPAFKARGLFNSTNNQGIVYVCGPDGLNILQRLPSGWKFAGTFHQVKGIETRTAIDDENGNVWIGTYANGIIRINISGKDTLVRHYGLEDGLPTLRDDNVFIVNGRLVFATPSGVYRYNGVDDKIVPDTVMGREWSDGSKGVFNFSRIGPREYLAICVQGSQAWVEKLLFTGNNQKPRVIEAPFRPLTRRMMYSAYRDSDSVIWIGVGNELYTIDERVPFRYDAPFKTLIRNITIGKDSLLFGGYFSRISSDTSSFLPLLQQEKGIIPEIRFADNSVQFEYSSSFYDKPEETRYSYFLEGYRDYWSAWSPESKVFFSNLSPGHYIFRVKARNVYGTEGEEASFAFIILPPWYRTIFAYIMYVVLAVLLVWGIVKYNTRRLQLEKIRLEGIVQERTAEILKQKKEIENQRDQIAAQKKDITDSIVYASRIQQAVLPTDKILSEQVPEHFILFKPRDIVSGDFYWITQKGKRTYIVAADCTGHGVPGAFMSMLGMSFLNEIVLKSDINEPAQILNELREHVITQLRQTGEENETKDGMDLSLVIIDRERNVIQFSGANNPMYVVRPLTEEEKKNPVPEAQLPRGTVRNENYELMQVDADRMPIGISAYLDKPFSQAELPLVSGYALYLLSDGYEDQFGGPQGKKFLSRAFKRLLLQIQDKPMEEQKMILDRTIEEWKGDLDQVDDILVIGFRL